MNDPISNSEISGSAVQVLAIVQSGVALRPIVARHPDLLSALIRAARIADERGKSELLIEIVARVACTGDRLAVADSHNAAEFAERILLADRAAEDLGDMLRELCPEALPIGGDVSNAPASN
jgi:hypothetical protein